MESTAYDRHAAVAPRHPTAMTPAPTSTRPDDSGTETSSNVSSGVAAPTLPPHVATDSRAQDDRQDKTAQPIPGSHFSFADERFSQSDPRSAEGSQASNTTSTTDRVFTPTPRDHTASGSTNNYPDSQPPSNEGSQLMQLSAIAASQDRMETDGPEAATGSRKRMADGEVKSPVKTHSRTTSAISMASTTSTIGDLSYDLRTRLSYAMVKVNNGWQSHSLDEVESLASQGPSPVSSTSTAVHRRNGSSASPQLSGRALTFGNDLPPLRHDSNSPPNISGRPALAPPAPIRPSMGVGGPNSHPRRNSNPGYTPTLLSHTHSASPRSAGQALSSTDVRQPHSQGHNPVAVSPHKNVREQDAIETLMFLSSPNHSANMKHTFSPNGSPDPSSQLTPRSSARQALPGSARKALPSHRPSGPAKRVEFDVTSAAAALQNSPMDLDTTQQSYQSPNRGSPWRKTGGAMSHSRGALSMPSALGFSHGPHRRPLTEKDIDQMLDRADEGYDSSDNEDIQVPRRHAPVPGAVGA